MVTRLIELLGKAEKARKDNRYWELMNKVSTQNIECYFLSRCSLKLYVLDEKLIVNNDAGIYWVVRVEW